MNKNKNVCKLHRFYKEPEEKYVCLSTSFFFKDDYIKTKKNLEVYNATQQKINSFKLNISRMIDKFDDGLFPKNFYYRIYFDKSISKVTEYKELIEKIKKHPRVQLIGYECNKFKTFNITKDVHIDLFGTLLRYHAFFDDESPNMISVISIDADNTYSSKMVEIYKNFENSNFLINGLMNLTSIGFHSNDYMLNFDFFDYIYLIGGFIMIKKNKIFSIDIWNKYFNNMFEQYDLMYVYNYLDFKKLAFSSVLKYNQLTIKSFYSFNYGVDEIWINYVLKKILIDNNLKNKLTTYICKDYNIKFLLNRLIDNFKYNSIVNKDEFDLFLKNSSFNSFKDLEEKIQKYINYKKLKNNNSKYGNVNNLFDELKKNKFINRLYIQNNIKYIIFNFRELLKKRGNDQYYSILYS
jgi:hypothetical protein